MKIMNNPSYFHGKDGTRIFFNTNFLIKEYDSSIPLIVLNYGLVCNTEHWREQLPFFQKHNFQILMHDYRCHFSSSGKDDLSQCHFNNMAQDLAQLLNSFNAKNIFMLGHSMGVNITLEYSLLYPQNLLGMVLISGSVLPPQDVMFDSNIISYVSPHIDTFAKTFPKIYKKFWETSYMNPLARKIVHRGGFNTDRVEQEFVHTYMKKIGELPPEIFLHLLNEMKEHDIFNQLDQITTPTLVIGGDKDKVIPNYLQEILHSHLRNSQFYIVKDGSHVPQVDFAKNVNERMLIFINSISA